MQIIIKYKKKGFKRFLSATETSNAIQRNLRRAGLDMEFSQGFHPHPKVSYLDSAPTGVIDLALYVMVQMKNDTLSLEETLRKISQTALKDLEPVEIWENNENLNKIVTGYEYLLFFKTKPEFEKIVKKHNGKEFVPIDLIKNLEIVEKNDFFVVNYYVDKTKIFNPYLLKNVYLAIRKKAFVETGELSEYLRGRRI